MTKEQFCECMAVIKKQYDLNETMLKGLEIAFGNRTVEYASYNIDVSVENMIKILGIAMGDVDDWIGYYVFECKWGDKWHKVWDGNKNEIPLKTYEDLYEVIGRFNDEDSSN